MATVIMVTSAADIAHITCVPIITADVTLTGMIPVITTIIPVDFTGMEIISIINPVTTTIISQDTGIITDPISPVL